MWVEGVLPVDLLRVRELRALCREVGTTADRLGENLRIRNGGKVGRRAGEPNASGAMPFAGDQALALKAAGDRYAAFLQMVPTLIADESCGVWDPVPMDSGWILRVAVEDLVDLGVELAAREDEAEASLRRRRQPLFMHMRSEGNGHSLFG